MSLSELCLLPARDLAARIAGGELSCTEVMRAFLARIEALNPAVNAICTLDAEGALQAAQVADRPRQPEACSGVLKVVASGASAGRELSGRCCRHSPPTGCGVRAARALEGSP